MKDLLTVAIYLPPIILTAITVTDSFAKAKVWSKILIVGTLSAIAAFAASWKEYIVEIDTLKENQIAKIAQIKRDSVIEIKHERDKLNIIKTFTDGFARYELKINNLLPLISEIKIKSVSNGLILEYQIYKSIETLTVALGPSPFDESFDDSFGLGVFDLPKKIGKNVYRLELGNVSFGQRITLLFRSKNPYSSLPIIDHYHTANNITDVTITADNNTLTVDSDSKIP